MSKILGLDLGTNSIGWAFIESSEVADCGVSVNNNNDTSQSKPTKSKFAFLTSKLLQNFRLICLTLFSASMFGLAIFMPSFWQFWINLGFAGILAILTLERKK